MWTPANTSLAWWTAALWLHSPHSAPELGESFADLRGHQAYQSGLKKRRPQWHHGTEANVLSPVWEMFYHFPLAGSGEWELYRFNLLMCLKYTPFFPHTHSAIAELWLLQVNQRAFAGLPNYKIYDAMQYLTSSWSPNTPGMPAAGAQSSVVGWLLPLWLELGSMQVVGLRKEKQEIFLQVNKGVWWAPARVMLSGENCFSWKLCSVSTMPSVLPSTEQ